LLKILLDILNFVDATKDKFGSLKVWNWIVQSCKIKPKSHHVINPPLSNLANHMLPCVNLWMDSQRWSKNGQSLVKGSQWWSNKKGV